MTAEHWPPLPESIQTPRLHLRRYRLSDAEDVFAYAHDPEWARFLPGVPQPYERQHADQFVASHVLKDWRTESHWALEHEGRVVGRVGMTPAHRHRRAELGYELARWLWGRGLMTEAASAVIDEAFRKLPLRKVLARAIAANIGSTRVMEKVGMRHEATLRQHWVFHGQSYDAANYGILREEWERNASLEPSPPGRT
ncbi:MAG: GNAT family N-acetyltransferase [Chloroflexi bacterium]|nr:GNAT family N-acetyltransferase [Chloroflexota bacterium]